MRGNSFPLVKHLDGQCAQSNLDTEGRENTQEAMYCDALRHAGRASNCVPS